MLIDVVVCVQTSTREFRFKIVESSGHNDYDDDDIHFLRRDVQKQTSGKMKSTSAVQRKQHAFRSHRRFYKFRAPIEMMIAL